MSQENLDAARRFWERFSEGAVSGRVDAGLSEPVLHPDVKYVEDPKWPGSGVYSGLDAIRARFAEYLEIFGAIEVSLQQTFDVGDIVGLVFGSRGQSVQTGLPFEHEWAYLLTFDDGRVDEWRAYFDKNEALEAVGLRE
jgi:ketosteroid isomerase-like protein